MYASRGWWTRLGTTGPVGPDSVQVATIWPRWSGLDHRVPAKKLGGGSIMLWARWWTEPWRRTGFKRSAFIGTETWTRLPAETSKLVLDTAARMKVLGWSSRRSNFNLLRTSLWVKVRWKETSRSKWTVPVPICTKITRTCPHLAGPVQTGLDGSIQTLLLYRTLSCTVCMNSDLQIKIDELRNRSIRLRFVS